MNEAYIYTVIDAGNNKLVVSGSADECAKAIGMSKSSIARSAIQLLEGKGGLLGRRYMVSRKANTKVHSANNYYEVRLRKTNELVCAGTSTECTKALGLTDVCRFRHMIANHNKGLVRKWIISSVPYESVSPDLTPIPPINNSASVLYNRHPAPTYTRPHKSNCRWYSVYLKKTDKLLCCGTSIECAKSMGMKHREDFLILCYKVRKGIVKKYEIYSEMYDFSDQAEYIDEGDL